jgi:hypothetical protein
MFDQFKKYRSFLAGITYGALALTLCLSSACSFNHHSDANGNDPKKVIQEYISRSFAVKSASDREALLALLTRDAKNRLSAWSDDQFREAFIDSKRQFVKLAFTESKSESPVETSITYELSYVDQSRGQNKGNDAKITQKKLAQLVKEQDHWLISDVRNIKELVEYKDEMSLP